MTDGLGSIASEDFLKNENATRISALIADTAKDHEFLPPSRELPIAAPLSHDDPYLSAPEFSVEEFLLSRSHTSLPDLRTELKDYLGTLKEELVQLINRDYAAFISLSTDLRAEGPRLEKLKGPLQDVQKEIQISLDELKQLEHTVQERLSERSALREEKARLHMLLKLSESLARLESLLLITPAEDTGLFNNVSTLDKSVKKADGFDERSRSSRVRHLSRAAAEFNQLLYLAEKARSERCAFVVEIQPRVDKVKSTLFSDLNHVFATALQSISINGAAGKLASEQDRARWKADLKECLRTYDSLGGWREAEDVIRREIMKPFIQQTIFAGALTVPHSPLLPQTPFVSNPLLAGPATPATPYTPFTSRPRKTPFGPQFITSSDSRPPLLDDSDDPLAGLYNKVLRFVDRDLKSFMETAESVSSTRHPSSLSPLDKANINPNVSRNGETFDILSNVVWSELARALTEELGTTIFAAGRPDEFRENYVVTQNFMAALELMAPSIHSVQAMRSHPSYVAFQRRWQLSVYFQLRWKDIVGKLEEGLKAIGDAPPSSGSGVFFSSQTAATFEAILSCWKADICIPEIGFRFWRLTLQILSRYKTWLEINLRPKEPTGPLSASVTAEKVGGIGIPSPRSATPIPPQESSQESAASDNSLLKKYGLMISDIKQLENKTFELWGNVISVILPDVSDDESHTSPLAALKNSLMRITDIIPVLASNVIAIIARRSCEPLTLVRAIPSQYRAMSNKKMPTEPSHFIHDILHPVKFFLGALPSNIRTELGPTWATEIFDIVCQRYISYLVAMKKTEESLRRLKKGKSSAFSIFGGSSRTNKEDMKDDERVKTQMILDVTALGEDARSLGVDVEKQATFMELKTLASLGTDGDTE